VTDLFNKAIEYLRFGSLLAVPEAGSTDVVVRRARTADVPAMKAIVDIYAGSGRKLLAKELVTLYEDVQDFLVAESAGVVVGCGALHVLWADLGEVRTLAVHPDHTKSRIGRLLLDALIATARELGLSRLFALTFHTDFFGRAGFIAIDGTPVDQDTYDALRRSYDPGVAEFLGLEYVKPNTLGNTRMLLTL
jgi:amino-acid N-acetyltransferase